jgi:hypothetical protein
VRSSVRDNASTCLALVVTLFMAAWFAREGGGWLEAAAASQGGLRFYWCLALVWLVCAIHAIRTRRRWLLLLTAPIVLCPAFLLLAMVTACLAGRCL